MIRPSMCTRTSGRPSKGGRPARPAVLPQDGALRRVLACALPAVAVGVGLLAGGMVTPVQAGWTTRTTATAGPLTMATVSSTMTKAAAAAGTLSADGSAYTHSNSSTPGYVDLVNSSTVPATVSLTITVVGVVGLGPVSFCTVPWTASGTCTPGATTIPASTLLSTQSMTYTTTLMAANARLYFKVTPGLGVGVTLTRTAVTPRAAGNRTTS